MTEFEMTYEKCRSCPECDTHHNIGTGMKLHCLITGNKLEVKECPKTKGDNNEK